MSESETRAELIDPALKAVGWGVVAGSRVLQERRRQCRVAEKQSLLGQAFSGTI